MPRRNPFMRAEIKVRAMPLVPLNDAKLRKLASLAGVAAARRLSKSWRVCRALALRVGAGASMSLPHRQAVRPFSGRDHASLRTSRHGPTTGQFTMIYQKTSWYKFWVKSEFCCWDQTQYPLLYLNPMGTLHDRSSRIDVNRQDQTSFPKFINAKALEYILRPGEMLYIPGFWMHYVHTINFSVSVTCFRWSCD